MYNSNYAGRERREQGYKGRREAGKHALFQEVEIQLGDFFIVVPPIARSFAVALAILFWVVSGRASEIHDDGRVRE